MNSIVETAADMFGQSSELTTSESATGGQSPSSVESQNDSVHGLDSLWYLPPDYTSPLPGDEHHEADSTLYVTGGFKWSQPSGPGTTITVTYSYSNLLDGTLGGNLSADKLRAAVEEALNLWAEVAPITFVEVADFGPPVSDIVYAAENHPQIRIGHEFIDGPSGPNILAHAWFPMGTGLGGDVHLDSSNIWTIGPSGGVDVIEVLTHELGHALGLSHEPMPTDGGQNAIMNPYYGRRFTGGLASGFLLPDDVEGIRAIYGRGVGAVIPLDSPNLPGPPPDDFGNSAADAATLAIGSTVVGKIGTGGDQDWFRFQATGGITYVFQTTLGTLPDSLLKLYASNGSTMLNFSDNASGLGAASRIEWRAPATGDYFLSVQSPQDTLVGTYAISASEVNLPPVLAAIGDQAMSHNQSVLQLALDASDPNGDALSYSAHVVRSTVPFAEEAYQLDQQYEFTASADLIAANYNYNLRGAKEKYFTGRNNETYAIFKNGELYRFHTSMKDLEAITVLHSVYYNDPSLLWNAQPTVPAAITANVVGKTLTIDPPADYLGTFQVEVTVSDGLAYDVEVFTVNVTNSPVTLAPIADKTISHAVDKLNLALSVANPDNDPLTFNIAVHGGSLAGQLDQQFGLYVTPDFLTKDYYANARGAGEKYLMGSGGTWFLLYADGRLFRWGTSLADSTLVATLDASFYSDPRKLYDPPASAAPPIATSVAGNTLTIDPPADFKGSFSVDITVSDGVHSSTQTFQVNVTNSAPQLDTISDQTISRSQDKLQISLSSNDSDGDLVSYSVEVQDGNLASQLDQQYGLYVTPDFLANNYYANARGAGEKYLRGNNGSWFLLYADGRLFRWGTTLANSTLVATLDPSFYIDPAKLWNAPAASSAPVATTVTGGILTIDPPTGYAGTFLVTVTATDGNASDSQTFRVTIGNVAPLLATIGDRSISSSADLLKINLSATDADGDAIIYTAALEPGNPAYALDRTRELYVTPDFLANNYYLNARGAGEKYLRGKDGSWFLIYSGGKVYKWGTSLADSTLIGTLGDEVYRDPSLLYDAQPRGADIAAASISGNKLTIDPAAGFIGSFQVTVTASDGTATDSETFTVTVAPSLEADESLNFTIADPSLYLNFDGADLSQEELLAWAGTDWRELLDSRIDPAGDGLSVEGFLLDWTDREAFIDRVIAMTSEQLAEFGVKVARHSGDAVTGIGTTTVFVGMPEIAGAYEQWLGLASDVDIGNDNATDIAFVLPFFIGDNRDDNARALSNLILHEAGHTWGLQHVDADGAGDLMGLSFEENGLAALARPDARFLDQSFPEHDHNGENRSTQNSHATLTALFAQPSPALSAVSSNRRAVAGEMVASQLGTTLRKVA